MADELTEQGVDEVILHHAGQCDVFCQYCYEDEEWKDRAEEEN